jgi:hypothetical protein
MKTFIRPRLRKPLGTALAGALLAGAWLVRGGPGWWWSISIAVTVLVRAITIYVNGGEDSDEGARAGSCGDERQLLINQRSWALTGKFALAAAFAGLTIAIAVRGDWWWPFAVMLGLGGLAYLFGWSAYGVGEEGQADEADADLEARSPVTQ